MLRRSPYARGDVHLIRTGKESESERKSATPALSTMRNLSVAEEDRTLEPEEQKPKDEKEVKWKQEVDEIIERLRG